MSFAPMQVIKMFTIPLAIYGAKQLNFGDDAEPERKVLLQVIYGATQALLIALYGLSWMRAQAKNEHERVSINGDTMSTMNYDISEARKSMGRIAGTTALTLFIGNKVGSTLPFTVQTAMFFFTLFEAPLIRIHIFGRAAEGSLKRPWIPPPGPLEKMNFKALMREAMQGENMKNHKPKSSRQVAATGKGSRAQLLAMKGLK